MQNLTEYPWDYEVYNEGGQHLGAVVEVQTVAELHRSLFLVIDTSMGFLHAGRKSVVPWSEISAIDDHRRRVYLNGMSRAQLEGDRYPEFDDGWWDKNPPQGFSPEEIASRTALTNALAAPCPRVIGRFHQCVERGQQTPSTQ